MISSAHFHPMMVHFPIALITVGFLFEVLSLVYSKYSWLSKASYWLEVLGMVGAVFAFGTGYFFTSTMEGEAGLMREKHELFATFSLITIIIAALFRTLINYLGKEQTYMKYISLLLFFLAFIFITITGYLGGSLVIDYMIGL